MTSDVGMLSNDTALLVEYERRRSSGASYGRCQCPPPQRKPVSPMSTTSETIGCSSAPRGEPRSLGLKSEERTVSCISRPSSPPRAVSCRTRTSRAVVVVVAGEIDVVVVVANIDADTGPEDDEDGDAL